jgi:hypothetical protein
MRHSKLTALITAALLTLAPQAQAVEVERCNALSEAGVYTSVLRVTENGKTTQFFIGERGLTSDIYYRDARLVRFLRAEMGMKMRRPANGIPTCGVQADETDTTPAVVATEPVAPAEPEVPEDPVEPDPPAEPEVPVEPEGPAVDVVFSATLENYAVVKT